MMYTLQSNAESGAEISIEHLSNRPVITIIIKKNLDNDIVKFLEFVLDKNELHDFIGTLLHVQSKMRK